MIEHGTAAEVSEPHIMHPATGAETISLGEMLRREATRRPAVIAVSCGEQSITWSELDASSNVIARALAKRGAGMGDFVTIAMPNGVPFIQLAFAAWKIGAIPQPVSARLPAPELAEIVNLANPKVIVIERATIPSANAVAFSDLLAGHDSSDLPDVVAPAWNAPTSGGSTGRPKLIVSGLPGICSRLPLSWRVSQADVALIPGPLYHNGPFGSASAALQIGAHTILMARFDAEELLSIIARERVTWLYLVPTMMARISRLPRGIRDRYDIGSLKVVWHMAAPCPPWLKQEWIDWLGPDVILEMYGGADANAVTMLSGREWLDHRGSVGRIMGGGEVGIFDPDGVRMPTGEVGEVYLKRATGVPPMFRHIGSTPRSLPGGWDSIGDMGSVDADGYLYLADRRTDMILVGGANVYPAEIEAAIEEHPLVVSSAVIGLPDDDMGNRVHAIVAADPALTEEVLRTHLAERLVSYKLPRGIEWSDEPLRDEAGKVRRGALRAARLGAGGP